MSRSAGNIGIGHTRWATHGRPTERQCPSACDRHVAVVHNGIIENFRELRERLTKRGCKFVSETDTEAVAHLVSQEMKSGKSPADAVAAALKQLRGAFALAFLFTGKDDLLIGARKGSPLAIGYGKGEMYLGSDAIALAPFTDTISYLEDGDWAVLTRKGVEIHDDHDAKVERQIVKSTASAQLVDKGNHKHFMAKEIHEQPEVVGPHARALHRHGERAGRAAGEASVRLEKVEAAVDLGLRHGVLCRPRREILVRALRANAGRDRYRVRIPLSRCAARAGRPRAFSFRSRARPPTHWRPCATRKEHKQHMLSVVNVPTSTIARESDVVMPTLAGPEIGVASTKAFTCQLAVLACLAIAAGRARGELSEADEQKLVRALIEVPRLMAAALTLEPQIEKLAQNLAKARDVLYLGRGTSFPIALEGALKLKEISYIHAEGYAAGELKHGPIALIDETMPVIVIAPYDRVFEKTVSNMQEVAARGGKIILVTDPQGAREATVDRIETLSLPDMASTVTPLVYAIPVQLIAYHTAVAIGTDVDQPRNLAKSVTVE